MSANRIALRLTADRLRQVLTYCQESGQFRWRIKSARNVIPGEIAGGVHATLGYWRIRIDGELHYAHRLAFLYMTGAWPVLHVDHMDGDKANNRWGNLRDVPRSSNMQNLRKATSSNKSTGLLGAFEDKQTGRWISKIRIAGRNVHLGQFNSAEEAHLAYVERKRAVHPGCTI